MNKLHYKLWLFLFFFSLTAASSVVSQTRINPTVKTPVNIFEISAKLEGLQEGEKIILTAFKSLSEHIIIDSVIAKDGAFRFRAALPFKGPAFCSLYFTGLRKTYRFALSNGEQISLTTTDIGNLKDYKHTYLEEVLNFTGSPTNRTHYRMRIAFKMHHQSISRIDGYIKKIQDSIGFNGELVEAFVKAKESINRSFYNSFLHKVNDKEIENRMAVALILYHNSVFDLIKRAAVFTEFYSTLTEEEKEFDIIKKMTVNAHLAVGKPFPVFTLYTPDKKQIDLKNMIAKSKVTLVHFWGSADYMSERSLPLTQQYHKELRAMYQQFHHKGLSIVGVAAEDSSTLYNYGKVLREQQFPWPNVSDLKGNMKGSLINDVYQEGGHRLPNVTNVLIDAKGNIIAWDPTGIELQYYIWKHVGKL